MSAHAPFAPCQTRIGPKLSHISRIKNKTTVLKRVYFAFIIRHASPLAMSLPDIKRARCRASAEESDDVAMLRKIEEGVSVVKKGTYQLLSAKKRDGGR